MPELVLPYAVLAALWLPAVVTDAGPPHTAAAGRSGSAPAATTSGPGALTERAVAAVVGQETHVVETPGGSVRSARETLTTLAGESLTDVGALLPAPGRAAGVPAVALLDAVEAGQCLLLRTGGGSWAVVPQVSEFGTELEPGTLVRWQIFPFDFAERPVPTLLGIVGSLRQARQDIATALVTAGDRLAGLDLPGVRGGANLAAEVLRGELPGGLLPPELAGPQVEVITRAARLLALTELAQQDDDGVVLAPQRAERARVLAELEDVARRALAAASISHRARG